MTSPAPARAALIAALALLLAQPLVPALGATYTMTLKTDQPAYAGRQLILVTGTISPAPGAGTAIIITISNAQGSLADVDEVVPNATTGTFNYTSHPGGNSAWSSGTFTVNATWGGDGAVASQVTTFEYTATASSTSSSGSTASSSSASSSTSSTTTPAPEFPVGALAALALIALGLVAVLSKKLVPRAVLATPTGRRLIK